MRRCGLARSSRIAAASGGTAYLGRTHMTFDEGNLVPDAVLIGRFLLAPRPGVAELVRQQGVRPLGQD
jgi:hypothetical protein